MTRKQRAAELRERLLRGPMFSTFDMGADARAAASKNYQLWVTTWVIPEIDALIPELRK